MEDCGTAAETGRSELQELKQAGLRLLAGREHSREELRRKLKLRASCPGLLAAVLDALEAEQALSDSRFTAMFIESRRRKGFGPVRIRLELAERGVDSELVDARLDEQDPVWWEQLQTVARNKFGTRIPGDFKERARRARFLEYRGFPLPQIRRLLWP